MIPDPFEAGIASGWNVQQATDIANAEQLQTDVVIVGSGAGGATAAEMLALAGFKVLILEAGPLKRSKDFVMEERRAYPELYQQSAAMLNQQQSIGIMQGRAVGGSTTVNWTTSIRTPEQTLAFWQTNKGVEGLDAESLEPYFEAAEQRLGITTWAADANPNNQVIADGCRALGWQYTKIKRNVKGCWNLGYCGMGCPINAKQSMLVTSIPTALNHGARLIAQAQVWQMSFDGDRVNELLVRAIDEADRPLDRQFSVKAKHVILAGGAINTPALLMRSNATDPHRILGRNTTLHPSLISAAIFDEPIKAHSGAPQSYYSDEFVWKNGVQGRMGFKIEAAPLHPVLLASKSFGFGRQHADIMKQFNYLQASIALVRDGFDSQATAGQVVLDDTGNAHVNYPLSKGFWEAAKRAFMAMAQMQFAAGAKAVLPIHDNMPMLESWSHASNVIAKTNFQELTTVVASAHVMGGCAMGEDVTMAWVSSQGKSHYYKNLSVMDGSVFPTSLGANPQLSIYAITRKNCETLIKELQERV
ncbi:GMC family oxidoreductase [Paraferrimonas haliotis]|uniref:GMC family oxidoreductase n=1 Tax=Paraferrimonas haliotis TaxID=2013866 RepID=UPI000BA94E9B|nr:GMC family oxidoreductase [Paraferrimonas haliotis]